jgi:aryl-alcohol dehydrogenase-like predicted oxidoreductase
MPKSKKLILGGAQIGQAYGLVRNSSFHDGQGVGVLLRDAEQVGFEAIDTARTYGRSEEILGRLAWRGEIHSKLDEFIEPKLSLSESLDALRRNSIELLYLCHDASRVSDTSHEYWASRLTELRHGADSFGVAIYPEQMDFHLIAFPEIQTVQIPFNILSPRKVRERVAQWHSAGKEVIARSVFAQGLLLQRIPQNTRQDLTTTIDFLHNLAEELSLDPAELALRWCLSSDDIDGIVVGVSEVEELESIAYWLGNGPLPDDEYSFIAGSLEGHTRHIDPRGN